MNGDINKDKCTVAAQYFHSGRPRGRVTKCFLISPSCIFLILQKYLSLNHIHIWQVPLQLSCSDTCQIWMWHPTSYGYFNDAEKLGKKWNSTNGLSNPHSRYSSDWCMSGTFSVVIYQWPSETLWWLCKYTEVTTVCAKPLVNVALTHWCWSDLYHSTIIIGMLLLCIYISYKKNTQIVSEKKVM